MLTIQRSWKSGVLVLGISLWVASEAVAQVTENGKSPPVRPSGQSKNESLYSDYRSWEPVNETPKWVVGFSLADRVAPNPEDSNPHENGFGYINVYVNKPGRDTYINDKSPKFDAGTVIVKEKLGAKGEKAPPALGIMIKREPGFAPQAGDWQFVYVDRHGKVSKDQHKLENCAKCHLARRSADFVFQRMDTEKAKPKAKLATGNQRSSN